MIQYIEKGYGLHQMLAAQGIELRNVDGVWIANAPDDQINQLIADYNPWPSEKQNKLVEITESFKTETDNLIADIPQVERDSWFVQRSEALSYPNGPTPYLEILAAGRGISLETLVEKVRVKAHMYSTAYFTLQARKDYLEDLIKTFPDNGQLERLPELWAIKFGV